MRVFKVFTTAQIIATSGIEKANLRKYLQSLRRAGYTCIAQPKRNGKSQGHALWRLTRDSGPKHPLPRRDGTGVYDPNHGVVYPYREEGATRDG